jgi:hypothetical protein
LRPIAHIGRVRLGALKRTFQASCGSLLLETPPDVAELLYKRYRVE